MRSRFESLGVSWPRGGLGKPRSLDHAVRAGKACLAGSSYKTHDVAALINAGVYRDRHYAEPAFACYIQEKLDINVEFQGRQTFSFDLLNGGCGLLNAVQTVSTLIQAGTVQVGMAIASEVNADRKPDPSWDLQPSGAALLLDVSPYRDRGFGAFVSRIDDTHHDDYRSAVLLDRKRGHLVLRKQPGIEDAYLSLAGEVLDALLTEEGLSRDQLHLVLPSQISADFLTRLPAALDLPTDKIENLSAELGDTLTTSWALALERARSRGDLVEGRTVALLAVGSGLTATGALYHC